MRYALLVVGLCLLVAPPASASVQMTVHDARHQISIGTEVPGMRVDWAAGAIYVTVLTKAPGNTMNRRAYTTAFDSAMATARQTLRAGLNELKLTSYATVGEAFTAHVLPEDSLHGICNALAPVVDRWDPVTRTLTLVTTLPMTGVNAPGELAARMLRVEQRALAASGGTPSLRPPTSMQLRPATPAATQISAGPYTGLLIDCTGLRYTPALLPKFVIEDGRELWGTTGLNSMAVMERGLVEFASTFRNGLQSNRVGDTPLILRPLGVCGPLRADLVFSAGDAALLLEQNANTRFLESLAIVIVLD